MVFAVALLDAAIIGAFAVSLSTAYAAGDALGLKHSLHRGFRQAKGFYAIYAALIAVAAAIVLIPRAPLGLIIEGVQALAGVLLPAATVFLLMLCNDRAVLGPWVNSRRTNMFTSVVITVLIALSAVLTASVVFPGITGRQIFGIILGCLTAAVAVGGWILIRSLRAGSLVEVDRRDRETWRMPPLNMLSKPVMSDGTQGHPDRPGQLHGGRDDPGHRPDHPDGARVLSPAPGRTTRVSRLAGHPSRGQAEDRMVLHARGAGIGAPVGHEHDAWLDQLEPAE